MKTLAISANIRKSVGKSDSKALRNQGMVPCVLYGGEKQVCFYAETNAFRNLVYTPEVYFVELNIDNNKYKAIMQDIQFHPVTDKILHIDFLEIFDDKEITISIPVTLKGLAIGVRNGGNLLHRRKKIITRGLPANLPDAIEVNIEELKIGDFIFLIFLSLSYLSLRSNLIGNIGYLDLAAAIIEVNGDSKITPAKLFFCAISVATPVPNDSP